MATPADGVYPYQVLEAVKSRLVTELDGLVNERWIDVVKDPEAWDNPQPSEPRNVNLRFGGWGARRQDGTGRQASRQLRKLLVRLYTRKAVDPRGTDEQWLLNEDFGHLGFEWLVFNALHGYWPVDPDDASRNLTACEIWLDDAASSAVEPKKKDPNQGMSVLVFDVELVTQLTQRNPQWS
jgi:hypothetical protein